MPLDGVTSKCLAAELNLRLADARLDRIHQPDRHDIILQLRSGSENFRLILSANPAAPRLHLTTEIRENPSEPPMFCMLLRKHLAGARLLDITTPGYERIFQLRFATTNELGDRLEKKLVVEIMGRHSNIILLNHENRIHDAILHIDQAISRVREVMPARLYVLPPDQKKMTPEDALASLAGSGEFLAGLAPAALMLPLEKALLETLQGFSPLLCREVLFLAGIDPRLKPSQLEPLQRKDLDASLRRVLETFINGNFAPTTFYDSPQALIPIDFHALPLHDFVYQKRADSVSQAMDLYYFERSRQNALKQKKQVLEKIIANQLDHCRKKLLIHETDCLEGQNSDKYRLYGELILANLHQAKDDAADMRVIDYYQPDLPEISIPLQSNLTAAQNAQRYFKLYGKSRARFESGTRFAFEDRRDIAYLETLQNALAAAVEPEDLLAVRQEISSTGFLNDRQYRQAGLTRPPELEAERDSQGHSQSGKKGTPPAAAGQQPGKPGSKSRRQNKAAMAGRQKQGKGSGKNPARPAALPPRQYTSSDGLTILVGRNNLQNDQLTLKTAQKDDLWLHVQKMPGTHVIIRTNRQPVPDRTLQEAAETAAWFSRAAAAMPEYQNSASAGKPGGSQKVAVDYCPVSHVRKPAGARPGMVIYDRYQTLIVAPKEPQAHS